VLVLVLGVGVGVGVRVGVGGVCYFFVIKIRLFFGVVPKSKLSTKNAENRPILDIPQKFIRSKVRARPDTPCSQFSQRSRINLFSLQHDSDKLFFGVFLDVRRSSTHFSNFEYNGGRGLFHRFHRGENVHVR